MFRTGILKGSKNHTLQAYGKLPLYSDYISVLADDTGNSWRAWLLKAFGRDDMRIPPGKWPFVFCPSPGSSIVVGLIEDSSDGIREFPFSIFIVYAPDLNQGWYNWESLISIWNQLNSHRSQLAAVDTIDACYNLLQGIRIEPNKRGWQDIETTQPRNSHSNNKKQIGYLRIDYNGTWPVLLGAPYVQSYKLHLLADAQASPAQILSNWEWLRQEG